MAPAGSSRTRFIPLRGLACGLGNDGNELPRVIQVIRVKGFLYIFVPSPFPYRVQRLLSPPFPCSMRTTFLGSRSLAGPVHQCTEVPRHITDVVKVIECIFQRPLDHSRQRLWAKGFLSVATMWTFAATFSC